MSSFSRMSGILHEVFIHVSCFLHVAPRRFSHQGAQARNMHKTLADQAQLVITLRYDRFFTRPPLPCFFRFWTAVVSSLRSPTQLGLAFRCTVWAYPQPSQLTSAKPATRVKTLVRRVQYLIGLNVLHISGAIQLSFTIYKSFIYADKFS